MLKQQIHEPDHLSLFPAEVTDQCSCNGASEECLHGVHRDSFTLYHCFGGMTQISAWTQFCPTENEGSVESWNNVASYSTVLCQNTECYLTISIRYGSLETSVHVGFPSM